MIAIRATRALLRSRSFSSVLGVRMVEHLRDVKKRSAFLGHVGRDRESESSWRYRQELSGAR